MTISVWDRFAALLAPPLVLALELIHPLRVRREMKHPRPEYVPPEMVSDYHELLFCRNPCWAETMHHVINWVSGEVTGECRDCGGIVELEGRPE